MHVVNSLVTSVSENQVQVYPKSLIPHDMPVGSKLNVIKKAKNNFGHRKIHQTLKKLILEGKMEGHRNGFRKEDQRDVGRMM